MNASAKVKTRSSKRGNVASIGHDRLTEWGERREARGWTGVNTLAAIREGGVSRSGHSNPTLACQIRDERINECQKCVERFADMDPDIAGILFRYYALRMTEREIAQQIGSNQRQVREQLLTGQCAVGAMLIWPREPQHVGRHC